MHTDSRASGQSVENGFLNGDRDRRGGQRYEDSRGRGKGVSRVVSEGLCRGKGFVFERVKA